MSQDLCTLRPTMPQGFHVLILLLLAWQCCSAPILAAQERPLTSNIRFGVLNGQNGMPHNVVYRIAQDRQGFLWFATMDGLARWDGYSMRVWRHDPDNPAGLSSSDIRCLLIDSDDILWIGTQAGGVNRFDPRTETFTRFRHRPNDSTTLDGDEVGEIYEDKTHSLWILASGTLHLFDRKTYKILQRYRSREAAANPKQQGFTPLSTPLTNTLENALHHALIDENGEVYVSGKLLPTKEKLTVTQQWGRLNRVIGTITPLFADTLLNNGSFRHIPFRLNDSVMFVGSQNSGLVSYNTHTNKIIRRYLPNKSDSSHWLASAYCVDMKRDRKGRIWLSTLGGGVSIYHPETDDFTTFLHDRTNPSSIAFNTISCIYEDRSGILWFGTPAGASYYDPKADKFTPYTAEFPDMERGRHKAGKPLLNSTRIMFRMQPTRANANALWICATSDAGLTHFDTRTETFTRFRNTPTAPKTLPNNNVYYASERQDGTLWLGLRHGGYVRFDPHTGKCKEKYLPEHAIMPVFEDSLSFPGKKFLWTGDLGSGMYRMDMATKELKNYAYSTANPRSFIGRAVFEITRDKHGRLWLGSMNGLSLYHPATDDFTNFVNDPANARSISCNYVECVVEDSKGRVWIGTEDGLNLFDEQKQDFTRFGMKDGLPSAVVLGILEDARGNLWLSTNHGLSCFNPEKKTFHNYDESDGLHGNTFNSHAYCRTSDGRFWFGGVGGFSAFHPDSLRDNDIKPEVVLTEFRKFNKPTPLDTAIGYKHTLELNFTDNFITIAYAALNFTHPEKNRYKYKLEGFDRDWIDAGTKREANYTNLDGGEYVFHVIASNNDGIWNMEGARLHIIVTPPFWKTRWFLFFGLATVISAIVSGMSVWNKERLRKQRQHYELETIQQQAEHERQLEIARAQAEAQAHERERIFRDIHDGLGAQIVEIAAMTEQLKSELPPPDEFLTESIQNEWVQAIMLSVYELRGSLREIVWLLNMENDSVEALIAYLRQETMRMLENASLHVSFSIDHALPNEISVHPDVRRNVVMAVREACANIVKHAGASAVKIRVHCLDNTLTLTLQDNGFGFVPENVRRFSNGIKIMQKRMALCGGAMRLDSAPGVGTTIVFSVPL